MTKIRLAAASVNQTPFAWETNRRNIVAALEAAREAEANVLCLPELCIPGYGCEDTFFSDGIQQTSLALLQELLPHTRGLVTTLGLPLKANGALYNVMALCCDGELLGFVAKQFMADDGIHYEPRWFKPWPAGEVCEVTVNGKPYPLGDLLFDCGGIKVGMEICRDAWMGEQRPGKRLATRGTDIILNPSASHFAFAKQEIRRDFVLHGSKDYHVSYAYCNLLGNESGRAIFDGGTLLASQGRMLAEGPRLSFADWTLATADVDISATRADRANDKRPRRDPNSLGGATVESNFSFPELSASRPATQPSAWDATPTIKEEEFTRAVPLGLFDYLRKSHSQGMIVSLSGGADSAAVATMIWLMVELGVAELGREEFLAKLSHIPGLSDAKDNAEIVHRLLTCVYQATRNSGSVTRNAAQNLAAAIGAEFFEWNIDTLVDGYVDTVSQAIGRKLTWETDDVALQNIQARTRGPGIWLLANLRGSLLLSTSNRSEAAVGYATMDGDTCGGLAPITGIDKAYLLDWLKWMEKHGPDGTGPLAALAEINCQQPTAELRPAAEHQTDEDDLMPYTVLDAIERASVRDRLMPVEIWQQLQGTFQQYTPAQLGQWIERFFTLWCRNQWKRERYAPSFHLDDENLDPKTWCRFPILSGGYERELAELRTLLAKEE